jgi:hypothetical protein
MAANATDIYRVRTGQHDCAASANMLGRRLYYQEGAGD